jgi:hypothetical protein
MITNSKLFDASTVTSGSAGTLYTAPANVKALIKKLVFANTDANNAYTLSVYLVPSGGTASDANVLRKTKTLAALETWECYEAENQQLKPGDFIAANASGSAIIAHGAGLLIT